MSVRDVFLIDKQFYINLYRFNQCPSRVFIIVSRMRSPYLRTESTLRKVISLSIQSGLKNPPISKAQYIYQDSKTLALTLLFQNILTTPPIKAIHNTNLGNAQQKFNILEKKKVKNNPGFESAISRLEDHCADHYTMATYKLVCQF